MLNPDIKLKNIFNELIGLECVDFLYNEEWSLIIYLGKIVNVQPLKTTWRLYVECPWRVENNKKIIVGSKDESEKIVSNLKVLQKLTIREINFDQVSKDLNVKFDHQIFLKIFAISTDEDLWELRKTDGYRLSLQRDFKFLERWEKPDKIE